MYDMKGLFHTFLNSVYCNSVLAVSMRLRRMYSETATHCAMSSS